MTGRTEATLIVFGNAGLWIIFIALAMRGLRVRYLCPHPNGFALRRPWEHCAGLGLMGLLSLLLPLLMVSDDWRVYGAMLPDHRPHLLAFAGIGLAGALLFWWMGRPTELAVNEGQRTYCWREGWFPFRRTQAGLLSDLGGVWAEQSASINPSISLVYVGWRSGAGRMVVGRCSSAAGAEHYADELAVMLGVPRLASDACRRPRVSERRRVWAEEAEAHLSYRRCRRYRRCHGE